MTLLRVTGKGGIRIFNGVTTDEAKAQYLEETGCEANEDFRHLSFDMLKPSDLAYWCETGNASHL
jgi:hypothetical protein